MFLKGTDILGRKSECQFDSCLYELQYQLASYLIVNMTVVQAAEVILPHLKSSVAVRCGICRFICCCCYKKKAVADSDWPGEAGVPRGNGSSHAGANDLLLQIDLPKYESKEFASEWLEVVIQYGYCIMFGGAFPLVRARHCSAQTPRWVSHIRVWYHTGLPRLHSVTLRIDVAGRRRRSQ